MSSYPAPRKFLRSLTRSPFLFPDLFEDFEDRLAHTFNEQTGLTVAEDEKNVIVQASLPGLKNDEIEITLDKGILQIKGEKKEEEQDKDKKFYRKAQTSYWYQLALPTQIDDSKDPNAVYKNGIMEITFPKAKQSQSKKIAIKNS